MGKALEGGRKLFDFSLLSGGRPLVFGTGNYLRFFISAALSQAAAKQTFDEASTHQHNLYTSQCLGNHQIFCFVKKKHLTPTPFLCMISQAGDEFESKLSNLPG